MNNSHPQIKELYKIYKQESKSPFRKVHRMIDLFESIIKTHTIVIMAEYFKRNQLSDSAKGLLAAGLKTPSLGTWQLFSRELYKELILSNHLFLSDVFPKEFEDLDKALNNQKTNVISFRNGYAHGATPSDADCEKDINQFEPFLERLLASTWIENTDIIEKEGRAILISLQNNDELSLHPLLIAKSEKESQPFAFFNDLKDDKVGLLNYPLSKHYREKEFFSEFNSYLPLKEWKKNCSSEFNHRIDELTETFKGRVKEREMIQQFVESQSKGYLSIQGNPGIGKSALIAKVYIDLTNKNLNLPIYIVPYFIRRGTAQTDSLFLLNYLLKNTDHYFSEGRNINAEGKSNWDLQQQLFSKWRAYGESNPKNKLVFLIDGLDEGVESEILRYLPRENFNHVLIIYGSRPGGHKQLESFWGELPFENHSSLHLTGLNKNDIRALLYEVSNKYEIGKNSVWIETIEKRSEGNPLYLKLLCNAIENGSITLNDPDALPKEIDDYYKAILDRYANNDKDGDSLLNSLYTFATALDYLTPDHLKAINGLGEAQAQRVESTLKEVLYENPLTEEVIDYQLFHESFREYLFKYKSNGVKQASERILKYCSNWVKLKGTFEQRYALQHYAPHLCKLKNEENINTLLALVNNETYINTQKKVLRGFDASKELFRISLTCSIENKKNEEAINAALKLIDLKYEEQNDVANIIAMVANNEIDIALQRITSFGVSNKEDKQRQFILFMLCFMELTLLESKEKPWRKSAIEKLLNHFDEQIPIDQNQIPWNRYFSSYIIFLIAVEFDKLEIDYLEIYKRTDEWSSNWILSNGPFDDIQFKVLISCSQFIKLENLFKCKLLTNISASFIKQGKIELSKQFILQAIAGAKEIDDKFEKSQVLINISMCLFLQGEVSEAKQIMNESLLFANGISDKVLQIILFTKISTSLFKQGKNDEAKDIIDKAISCEQLITHNLDIEGKIEALTSISNCLFLNGNLEQANLFLEQSYSIAQQIKEDIFKCRNFGLIFKNLLIQGKIERSNLILENLLECLSRISIEQYRERTLLDIASTFIENNNTEKALLYAARININNYKFKVYRNISNTFAENGDIQKASKNILNTLSLVKGIIYQYDKEKKLNQISIKLFKQGNLNKAIACVDEIQRKGSCLANISETLAELGQFEEALSIARKINSAFYKYETLNSISKFLFNNGNKKQSILVLDEAIETIKELSNNNAEKSIALANIANTLFEQGSLDQAKKIITQSSSLVEDCKNTYKQSALQHISDSLFIQGNIEQALQTIHQTIFCIQEYCEDIFKSEHLANVSNILVSHKQVDLAIKLSHEISDMRWKSYSFICISKVLFDNKDFVQAKEKMEIALSCSKKTESYFYKFETLNSISNNLYAQGDFDRAQKVLSLCYKTIQKVTSMTARLGIWERHGQNLRSNRGWKFGIEQIKKLPNNEAKLFYRKGLVSNLDATFVNEENVLSLLQLIYDDTNSIETILNDYALNSIFYTNTGKNLLNKFNNSLNLQWALDIKSKFNKEDIIKSSDNISEWLNEVSDEDDKEQVLLWAKQVSKSKLSEQDFLNHIKSIVNEAN